MALDICIPTRNRQYECMATLKAFEALMVPHVTVYVVDNSDDPSIFLDFLKKTFPFGFPSWLRFEVKPHQEPVRSMRENWERALDLTTADWVCFIGDDDFVDPKVEGLLSRLRNHDSSFDYLSWSHMRYQWPGWSDQNVTVEVKMSRLLKPYPIDKGYETITGCVGKRPLSLASVYHGALHRSVINKVRTAFTDDNNFFKHSNVDYFSGWLSGLYVNKAAYSNRPLSVAGASAKSNSATVRKKGAISKAVDIFLSEAANETASKIPDRLYTAKSNSMTQYFYLITQDFFDLTDGKFEFKDGWKDQIVVRAQLEVEERTDYGAFEELREDLQVFLDSIGATAEFAPKYQEQPKSSILAKGLHDDRLLIHNNAFSTESAGEFYQMVDNLLTRVEHIGNEIQYVQRGK